MVGCPLLPLHECDGKSNTICVFATNYCMPVPLPATGNEGYGLRPTVKRCCTQLVQIEMDPPGSSNSSRRQQLVDSLNVSVATGILLHQLLTTARQQ